MKPVRAVLTPEERVLAAWASAVGKRLAGRTRALKLVRDRLVIEVEDALWQRNLHALRTQILSNLREALESEAPADLEFRIGTIAPRRPPARQEFAVTAGLEPDEADLIADPVMGRIYRAARRKATA